MAEPETVPTSEVLGLLAAIREALTAPYPAASAGRAREWLLVDRASVVNAVIDNLVEGRRLSEVCTVSWWAGHLRDLTAEYPATYPVAGGGGQAPTVHGGSGKGELLAPATVAGVLREAARVMRTHAPTVMDVAPTIRLAAGADPAGRARAEEVLAFLVDHSGYRTLADWEAWRKRRTCLEVVKALELAAAAAEQGGEGA
ncbi:hypothetical protein [Streptosporangium sp. V21-05]|uniref:hypothetical protein n=1 Tax=Streptosporangium sp. V21-05 TaxID=3446115 RepID=UPI003F52D0B9